MKMQKNIVVACLGALALGLAGACLIPDKDIVLLITDCGHEWVASTPGAQGTNGLGGLTFVKTENESWIAKRYCVKLDQDTLLADTNSWFYQDVLDDVIAECKSRATTMGLANPDCDQVAAISYIGECAITSEECFGTSGDENGDAGAETGEMGLILSDLDIADEVSLTTGAYIVSPLLIDTVLADPVGVSNDGTTAEQVLDTTASPYGFEIDGVTSTNLGGALGFQNGDVITSVSGQSTQTYSDLLEVVSILLAANSASVTVLRGTSTVTLHYQRGS